jgi:hypothetical protein
MYAQHVVAPVKTSRSVVAGETELRRLVSIQASEEVE